MNLLLRTLVILLNLNYLKLVRSRHNLTTPIESGPFCTTWAAFFIDSYERKDRGIREKGREYLDPWLGIEHEPTKGISTKQEGSNHKL